MACVLGDCRRASTAITLAIAVVVALAPLGCTEDSEDGGATSDAPLAPPFTLETLDGVSVSLADHLGQVVLLSFWATWSPPCREEMPLFNDLRAKYSANDFEVLAVTLDDRPYEVVPAFVRDFSLDFPILIGTRELLEDYEFLALPTTFLISREGRIVEVLEGSQPLHTFEPLILKYL